MRRFALPFALSLILHAGFVGLMLALPRLFSEARPLAHGSGRLLPLNITMVMEQPQAPPRPTPPAPRPEKDWMKTDVEPVLIRPTSHAAEPPASASGTDTEEGPGGVSPANGGAEVSMGSSVLPVSRQVDRVVYLVDRSISMGHTGALARARRELTLSVRALPPGTLFQVFVYNRNVTPLILGNAGLVAADDGTIGLAVSKLEQLGANGSTDHVAALKRGLSLRPQVLFLLTDADNLTDDDVEAVRRHNTASTALHVVEMSRLRIDSGDGPLARLAAATGGTYRRVQP